MEDNIIKHEKEKLHTKSVNKYNKKDLEIIMRILSW